MKAFRLVVGAVAGLLMTSAASANDPVGACCFPNGLCDVVMVTPCEFDGGSFIGEGTTCEEIDCQAPVAVPMLSVFGLVATFGALGSLGVFALLRRVKRR